MALRNFWIEADIDGRKSSLMGGPRSSDGGFDLEIRQKDQGESVFGIRVTGKAHADGTLVLSVWDRDDRGHERLLAEQETTARRVK